VFIVVKCIFLYRLSPETFGYALVHALDFNTFVTAALYRGVVVSFTLWPLYHR